MYMDLHEYTEICKFLQSKYIHVAERKQKSFVKLNAIRTLKSFSQIVKKFYIYYERFFSDLNCTCFAPKSVFCLKISMKGLF